MKLLKYTYIEHIVELRKKLLKVLICFFLTFIVCYINSEKLFQIILQPLLSILSNDHKIIYTNLSEVFTSYLMLSVYISIIINYPIITFNVYKYIIPALYSYEKSIVKFLFISSNLLLLAAIFFVWYLVIPKVWYFFLGFERYNTKIPLMLETKIGEYLKLTIQFISAFSIAFQMPVILITLSILRLINSKFLINIRRIAIVIIFIIAGIITPPDILSQFILAIPMIILYELTILIIKLIEKKITNARR